MFDNQTKKFCSAVVDALPDISEAKMQAWIQNPKGLQKALADAICSSKWYEKDGVIYFSVTSDGTTGPHWVTRLEKKGFRLSSWAKEVLNSSDFKSTSGVIYNCAVLKGGLFSDNNRNNKSVRAEAYKRNFASPNAEVACLIRENLSDEDIEEMGFWWLVVMHKSIKDFSGNPNLLGANRSDIGRRLNAYYDDPNDNRWSSECGFVFVFPQV